MEIFIRDAGSKTGKRRSLFVNFNICLLTSHPIPERHFHFRAFERGFGMYEDTKWHMFFFKIKQFFG